MSQGTAAPFPAASNSRTINLIVVHCSATPSGKRLGGGLGDRRVTAAQVIDGWHANRGFARQADAVAAYNPGLPHIGYHYVIDLDGRVQGGRRLSEVGAHVVGHNANSIGICLVGGAEPVARYTQAQWAALKNLVATFRAQIPGVRVVGHRDLSPDANGDGRITRIDWLKTCPGFDVAAWLQARCTPPAGQVVEPAAAAVTPQEST
ncbi:MAG: hypothetical protein RL375_2394 [Pseudomonadota bacterium]|jgi:hypothetical protein